MHSTQKIETLEEVQVYGAKDNPWVKVFFNKVRFPDGRLGHYNRIVEGQGETGVAILPIFDKKVGLVQQYRYPVEEFLWEIPRGFSESTNTLLEVARELYEETGIRLKPDSSHQKLIDLGTVHPNTGLLASEVKLLAFICEPSDASTQPNDQEVIQFEWFDLKQVLAKVSRSEITDSFTICALFKAQMMGIL